MQRRIVNAAVITAVVALLLFVVPLAAAVYGLDLAQERSDLERDALNAALTVDARLPVGDQPELPPATPGRQLGLYDGSGRLIAGTGPADADPDTARVLGLPIREGSPADPLVTVVPLSVNEATTGAIRSAAPMTVVWERASGAWAGLALVSVAAVCVAWLCARRSALRISIPMEHLAAAVVQLGEGRFTVHLDPTGIPELDRAGRALTSAAANLDDLVTRERRLAANASHQLRTPLAGLRAVLEEGLAGRAGGMKAAVERAIIDADRLDATITDVIALTKGTVPCVPDVGIGALVEAAAEKWNGPLAALSRPLRLDIEPDLPPAVVAPTAVVLILDILLDNTLRHGAGTVTLAARATGPAVAIDVADEGGNIPDDSIFEHGVSGHSSTGVGLALAKSLASDQQGRLLLSRRAPTTVFTLLLPQHHPSRTGTAIPQGVPGGPGEKDSALGGEPFSVHPSSAPIL